MARVMACDDDRVIRGLLQVNLEMEGHEVLTAADGQEAIDRARAEQPDLILLDVMMPKVNGWQAAEALKADPATRHIPIIFLSARAMENDLQRGADLSVEHYVTKPFDPGELMALVQGLLAGRPTEDENP